MIHNTEILYRHDQDTKMHVKSVKLVKDGGYGYALDVTWIRETPECIQEVNIPRVWIPISGDKVRVYSDSNYVYGGRMYADIGFGERPIGFNNNEAAFTVKTIKEKTKEMTLEEIEKKLGHKVKIISKEENK